MDNNSQSNILGGAAPAPTDPLMPPADSAAATTASAPEAPAGPAVGVAPTSLTGTAPIEAAAPAIDPAAPSPAGSTADTVPPISSLATSVAASESSTPLSGSATDASPLTPADSATSSASDPLSTTSTISPNISSALTSDPKPADASSTSADVAANPLSPSSTDASPAASTTPPNPLSPGNAAGGALDTSGPLVGDQPILGQAPAAKPSPILNSAPAITKKFDPKYMIPIIGLAITTVGLGVFLVVELVFLKPGQIEEAYDSGKKSVDVQVKEVYNTRETEVTTEQDPLIAYSSNNSLDGNGTYLLSASGPKGLSALANTAATSVEFTVNWSDIASTYPDIKSATGTAKYTASGPDQKITEILYGTVNNKNYYFFILEDGTVAYIDVEASLNAKAFAATVLDEVTDVAKLLTSTSSNAPTVLAQKITGEYYDLSSYLN